MKPTADLKRFFEAVEWFRQRAKVPADVAGEILRRAEAKSVVLTSKLQLDMVLDVYRKAEDARAGGLSFQEFKADVRKLLPKQAQSIATVFRESVQESYAKSRAEALSEPSLLLARPYWRYTAILDGATTVICKKCHGTTLPAHHPWWRTHLPPLHLRCRSTIVALTPSQAKAYGVTKRPTQTKPEGWESKDGTASIAFGKVGAENLPEISKMPAKFRAQYEKKVERVKGYFARPKSARAPVAAPPIAKPKTHS